MNRLVESSIEFLLREPDKHLNNWLSRAETYFPMIERIFAEEGVPEELKYLAMVESGLNPRAKSWARAVGMWQFIGATGRAYDLNVNGWVDDRMDPEKSTRAAARHLKDLHKMFGDWQLALAGYNYSPGKLRRALRRAEASLGRKATFWDIYTDIPRETRNYVPMFIATSLIVSHPEEFNLKSVEPGPPYAYHVVPVYGMHQLSTLADLAGTSTASIKALNPSLTRSGLPPSSAAFLLRIPTGTYDSFVANYEKLPKDIRKPATEHVVRKGETLSEIAVRYGTSVTKLKQQNGIQGSNIRIGQRLAVPLLDYSGSTDESLIAQADGALVQYGPRNMRPISAAPRTTLPTPVKTVAAKTTRRSTPSGQKTTYRVKSGDTLSEIAREHGVSLSKLRGWNNIRGSRIRVGQRLTIYSDSGPKKVTHTVKQGETLVKIANRYSVSVSNLREWNSIKGSTIYAGQRLVVFQG
jgi:membrane-bound lytic murein transglycosylase D